MKKAQEAGAAPGSQSGAGEAAPEVDVRGQLTIPLDGQEYLLRPSYEAIIAIERQLGPLYNLATAAARGDLTLDQMGVCVAELMKAQGRADAEASADYRDPKPEKLAKLIYAEGAPKICARLAVLFTAAVTGGYTPEGEAKAGTP